MEYNPQFSPLMYSFEKHAFAAGTCGRIKCLYSTSRIMVLSWKPLFKLMPS